MTYKISLECGHVRDLSLNNVVARRKPYNSYQYRKRIKCRECTLAGDNNLKKIISIVRSALW